MTTARRVLLAALMSMIAVAALSPAVASAGKSSDVAALPQPRSYHTATLLQDGTVLIAGGAVDGSAETYDAGADSWTATKPMAQVRSAHTATRLGDGRVLVTGGTAGNGTSTSSAEMYDPASRAWAPTAPMQMSRSFHTATLLDDGRVLVAGGQAAGHGPFVREAEIFDPASGAWVAGGVIELPRSFHAATKMPGGAVLVTGGQGAAHDNSLADATIYDPASNSWSPAPQLMGAGRVGHTSTLLPDNTVLLAGGSTKRQGDNDGTSRLALAEVYDPAARAFRPAPPLPEPRAFHTAAALPDGKVLLLGGLSVGHKPVRQVVAYDPAAPAWVAVGTIAALPDTGLVSATVLAGEGCGEACGSLLVVGGDSAELFGSSLTGNGDSSPRSLVMVGAALLGLVVLASIVFWRRRSPAPPPRRVAKTATSARVNRDQAARVHNRHVSLVTEREVPLPDGGPRFNRGRRRATAPPVDGAAVADAEEVVAALESALGVLGAALSSLADLRRQRLLGKVEEDQARVERAAIEAGEARQALGTGDLGACGKAVAEAQRELGALGGTVGVALNQELGQAAISKARRAAMQANVAHLQQAQLGVEAARAAGPRAAFLADCSILHAIAEGWALAADVLAAQAAPGRVPRRRDASDDTTSVVGPQELETFAEVGGLEEVKAHLRRTVGVVLERGADAASAGIVHNGILLYGPPGTGKTLLARAVAGEYGLRFLHFSPALIASAFQHEPARKLRDVFAQAAKSSPCLLFLDEVDAIGARRDRMVSPDQRELATQLLTSLEEYREVPGLVIMAATNDYDHLDPALREGRFDSRVAVPLPDLEARKDVLKVQLERVGDTVNWHDVDLGRVAGKTAGRSSASLAGIVAGAAERAMSRGGRLGQADLLAELESRSGTDRPQTLQDQIGWDDVVLPEAARQRLAEILLVFQQPDLGRTLGVRPPAGILLYGPPGTGKTTVARALASEVKASFYELSAADLLSKWVGESEQKVAQMFTRARANRPSIIFVDEVDALLKRRSAESSAAWEERVVSQFLRELDGLNDSEGVLLVGATNRIDIIDEAVRERRLVPIEVPLPDHAGRLALLEGLFRPVRLGDDVDLESVAGATDSMSGADLKALRDAAGMRALTRAASSPDGTADAAVTAADVAEALSDRGVIWSPPRPTGANGQSKSARTARSPRATTRKGTK